jgi:acylphosphatase
VKRFHIFVSGRVQGVFFRDGTVKVARKIGVVGWVKNLEDGRVEIVAEGAEKKLNEFVEWLKRGTFLAKVYDLTIEEEEPTNEFSEFYRKN